MKHPVNIMNSTFDLRTLSLPIKGLLSAYRVTIGNLIAILCLSEIWLKDDVTRKIGKKVQQIEYKSIMQELLQ